MPSEAVRGYIYRIIALGFLVALFYGILSDAETELWLQVVAGILGLGTNVLASLNTSVKKSDG